MLLTKNVDVSDDELEDMNDEKPLKSSKVKRYYGLVIPYLSTEKGEIVINFK